MTQRYLRQEYVLSSIIIFFFCTTLTVASTIANKYHTVVIDGNLPKIRQDYISEERQDCPSADYWLKQMDDSKNKSRYKVQYIESNGPRSYY